MNQSNLNESEPTQGLPKGFVYFKGQIVPKKLEEGFHEIYDWSVKEDDVWVITFPKSGTTWMQEMVWMIINDMDFEREKKSLFERSPFIELSFSPYASKPKEVNPGNSPAFKRHSVQYTKDMSKKERICIKTHLNWNLLPREIQEGTKRPKIIYVTRNPKDVCVSFFNHHRVLSGYTKSFEEFVESFLEEKLQFMPYWRNVHSYYEQRHRSNILFVKYEEMIEDLPSVIRRVAEFVEKPLKDDQVKILTDHLSFSSMKKNPWVNYEDLVKRAGLVADGSFMWKGKAGTYKEMMNEEMINEFDSWIERNVGETGVSV